MTEFVYGLAVVVALGVVLLAVHQVWFAIAGTGRSDPAFADPAVPAAPARTALYAVEALDDEPAVQRPDVLTS